MGNVQAIENGSNRYRLWSWLDVGGGLRNLMAMCGIGVRARWSLWQARPAGNRGACGLPCWCGVAFIVGHFASPC